MGARPQVLLIAPRDSYRISPYIDAAQQRGIDLVIASEGPSALAGTGIPGIRIELRDPAHALERLLEVARESTFRGVIGTDDGSIELAAQLSARIGLPHNSPVAVKRARRKDLAREQLASSRLPVPQFRVVNLGQALDGQLAEIAFPCVAKPVSLSASRGVIRTNNHQELIEALGRIRRILRDEQDAETRNIVLVEQYIDGDEVAIEGLLTRGQFELLAIFDKPDPLKGPYFEETYYITPSRHPSAIQEKIVRSVAEACSHFGLSEGPIHAECRINQEDVWILEVAARTIGGLCGRLLRFGTGLNLEETVLNHLLGLHVTASRQEGGAGVLMIPIPQTGILRRVEGLMAAQCVKYVEEIVIDVREGYELVPLPDGSGYLGFIFARAPSPELAEMALREAHAALKIVVAPLWKAEIG